MSKTVISFTAQLVQFDTTVPFSVAVSRLEEAVNKADSADIIAQFRAGKTQEHLASVVKTVTKGRDPDFLYFTEIPHHRLLEILDGSTHPGIITYTIGNPLIAQSILKLDPLNALAPYSIPPRFLLAEKPDRSGTTISYHLPSSVMAMASGKENPALEKELQLLDAKLEKLALKIAAV